LESRVKACLLKEEREREKERDVVVHPFPKKKIEGEKKFGYLLTQGLLPYFFTLGKNGHETMVIMQVS